jgi:hypothetical protein
VFALASSLAARGGSVEERYLSYVYVPVTLILLELVARLLSPPQPSTAGFVRRLPAILLALWLCFPLRSVAVDTVDRFRNGAGGYNTRKWRESETIAYAKQMLTGGDSVHVYSNVPDGLWELARVDALWLPGRTADSLTDLEGRWPTKDGSVLVWFKNITWRKYLFTVEELEEVANVTEVAHFSDGSVYRVSVRPTTAHD